MLLILRKNEPIPDSSTMAALREFFRRGGSSTRTSMTSRDRSPDDSIAERYDGIWLEWKRSHLKIYSTTYVGESHFIHNDTSISHIRRSQVARAVYILTQLRRIRELAALLESELEASKHAFTELGIMFDSSMPEDLMLFLSSDMGIFRVSQESQSQKRNNPGVKLTHPDVWHAASGVLGLLALSVSKD